MSIPSAAKNLPISHLRQLADYLAAGEKPRDAWLIGTEHEKFGFRRADLRPPAFAGEAGIGVLLENLAARYGWSVSREGEAPVALFRDGASITLEPAGQLELSGAPLATIHHTREEIDAHLEEIGRAHV